MKYLIKVINKQMYFKSIVDKNLTHFVFCKSEAYVFKNKWEANKILKRLKQNKYEIIKF